MTAGAIGACTACAIQLGADPVWAPFVAVGLAVGLNRVLTWVTPHLKRLLPSKPPVKP